MLYNNQKLKNKNNSKITSHLSKLNTVYNTDLEQKCSLFLRKRSLKMVESGVRCNDVNVSTDYNYNYNNANG